MSQPQESLQEHLNKRIWRVRDDSRYSREHQTLWRELDSLMCKPELLSSLEVARVVELMRYPCDVPAFDADATAEQTGQLRVVERAVGLLGARIDYGLPLSAEQIRLLEEGVAAQLNHKSWTIRNPAQVVLARSCSPVRSAAIRNQMKPLMNDANPDVAANAQKIMRDIESGSWDKRAKEIADKYKLGTP